MNRYASVLIALSFAIAFGAAHLACHRQKNPGIEFPPIIEPLKEEEKVGLHLRATAKGNTVFVQVGNYLGQSLYIDSRRFGVITPDKKLVKWDPKTMQSKFPARMLKLGDTVSGFLRFDPLGDLVGMRFVYYPLEDSAAPVFTNIVKFDEKPGAIPAQKPPVNPLK